MIYSNESPLRSESSDNQLDEKDVEFLIETLQEYVKELRLQLDAGYKYQLQLIGYVSGVTLSSGFAFGFLDKTDPTGSNFFSKTSQVSVMLVALVGIVAFALLTFFNRSAAARSDIRRLASIVQRLSRRASQLRDRGHISFAQRVIIDVRLADAESALYRAKLARRITSSKGERVYYETDYEDKK